MVILVIILLTLSKSCIAQGPGMTYSPPLRLVHVAGRKLCLMGMFKIHKFLNRVFPTYSNHSFPLNEFSINMGSHEAGGSFLLPWLGFPKCVVLIVLLCMRENA